jgi:hypothetical protein
MARQKDCAAAPSAGVLGMQMRLTDVNASLEVKNAKSDVSL